MNQGDGFLLQRSVNHYIYIYMYIYIYIYLSCCLHGYSRPLSRHFSLSFIDSSRSSGLYLVSSLSSCMYDRAGRLPAFARPNVGVHRSTSLMSSSLLLQQCPACLVRLICIVFVMGGRWSYRWCFVGVASRRMLWAILNKSWRIYIHIIYIVNMLRGDTKVPFLIATGVLVTVPLLTLDCSIYPWPEPYERKVRRYQISFFWVFGRTQLGIEQRSPGLLAITLTTYIYIYIYMITLLFQ